MWFMEKGWDQGGVRLGFQAIMEPDPQAKQALTLCVNGRLKKAYLCISPPYR